MRGKALSPSNRHRCIGIHKWNNRSKAEGGVGASGKYLAGLEKIEPRQPFPERTRLHQLGAILLQSGPEMRATSQGWAPVHFSNQSSAPSIRACRDDLYNDAGGATRYLALPRLSGDSIRGSGALTGRGINSRRA